MNLRVLFLIMVMILSFQQVNASDNEIDTLNSVVLEDAKIKIYEIIEIHEDSTFNTYYIETKNRSEFVLDIINDEIFQVWDYSVIINNKQEKFYPRWMISDQDENPDGKFHFKHKIEIDDTKDNFIVLTFWTDNINGNPFWYPYDRYNIKLQELVIQDEITRTTKIVSAISNLKPYLDAINNARLNTSLENPNLERIVSTHHKIVDAREDNKYVIVTTETSLSQGKIGGFSGYLYEFIEGQWVKSLEYPYFEEIKQIRDNVFERDFFPPKFLFWLLGLYVIFIVLNVFVFDVKYKSESLNKKYYRIYAKITLPAIFVEFALAFLPPLRPRIFTLFDTIILWPILIPLISLIIKRFPKFIIKLIEFVFTMILFFWFLIKKLFKQIKRLKNLIKRIRVVD